MRHISSLLFMATLTDCKQPATTMTSITNRSDDSHKYNDDIPLERRHSINSTDSDPVGVYFVRSKQALCVCGGYGTDLKQHGPHDTTRHSRWPIFLRIRGSVVPAMILPLTFITLWSTCITCIFKFVYHDSKCFTSAVLVSSWCLCPSAGNSA